MAKPYDFTQKYPSDSRAKKYTQEKVNDLLEEFQEKLQNIQPVLHPTSGAMSLKQFGTLNAARSKKKRYENNIIVLKLALKKELSDNLIDELLQ